MHWPIKFCLGTEIHENSGYTEDLRGDVEEKVRQVANMGFKPWLARKALEAAAMNVHEAVELLGMSQLILTSATPHFTTLFFASNVL